VALGKVYLTVSGNRLTVSGNYLIIGEVVGRTAELVHPIDIRSRRESALIAEVTARGGMEAALIQELRASRRAVARFTQTLSGRSARSAALYQTVDVSAHIIRHVCLSQELTAFQRGGWEVWATNLDTGAESSLGFIRDGVGTLTGVTLADGYFLVRTRPSGCFWGAYQEERSWLIVVQDGELATPLPLIQTLAYQFRREDTLVWWQWIPTHITFDPTDFAVWTSETEPVDTSGDPTYTIGAGGTGRYSVGIVQGANPLYVAVRARRGSAAGPLGLLSIPTPPPQLPSPSNQLAWM
jgi:hypothetical protein